MTDESIEKLGQAAEKPLKRCDADFNRKVLKLGKETLQQRFWARVKKTKTCWLWTGSVDDYGYASMTVNYKHKKASRISHELFVGPIPDGLSVLHHCDNPLCVRPIHLWLGTQLDNNQDREKKGRGAHYGGKGNKTHCANGHQYSKENTRIAFDGMRRCRQCAAKTRKLSQERIETRHKKERQDLIARLREAEQLVQDFRDGVKENTKRLEAAEAKSAELAAALKLVTPAVEKYMMAIPSHDDIKILQACVKALGGGDK